jgi:transposase
VKLIAPEAVIIRPFVKKGKKNHPADAAALCEAASRPDMMFVPVKTIEQQGILRAVQRSLLLRSRQSESKMPHANANRPVIAEWWFPRHGAV